MNIFDELEVAIKKESYSSDFDFGQCEINEKDIKYIKKGEQVLRKRFMSISDSLFEICILINNISKKFKKSGDFMNWYESNGITKDKISELNKRFIFFQEFPDHKDFISNLSIRAIKYLTHKDVTGDAREIIVSKGVKDAEKIKRLLEPIKEQIAIEFRPKAKPLFQSKFKKMKKEIRKVKDSVELASYKADIGVIEAQLKEMKETIRLKEKEWENKNNLKLVEEL